MEVDPFANPADAPSRELPGATRADRPPRHVARRGLGTAPSSHAVASSLRAIRQRRLAATSIACGLVGAVAGERCSLGELRPPLTRGLTACAAGTVKAAARLWYFRFRSAVLALRNMAEDQLLLVSMDDLDAKMMTYVDLLYRRVRASAEADGRPVLAPRLEAVPN